MSKNFWVISDTHFSHENILKFTNKAGERERQFDSIIEMNELMVRNWNSVVRPGDHVYHLGDVFFGSRERFLNLWVRLMGKKRLIVGNHDNIRWLSNAKTRDDAYVFRKIEMWRGLKDFQVVMTHVPLDESVCREGRFGRQPRLNVHGHIHSNPSPTDSHYCVCVEQTNYMPVNLEDLRDEARKRF